MSQYWSRFWKFWKIMRLNCSTFISLFFFSFDDRGTIFLFIITQIQFTHSFCIRLFSYIRVYDTQQRDCPICDSTEQRMIKRMKSERAMKTNEYKTFQLLPLQRSWHFFLSPQHICYSFLLWFVDVTESTDTIKYNCLWVNSSEWLSQVPISSGSQTMCSQHLHMRIEREFLHYVYYLTKKSLHIRFWHSIHWQCAHTISSIGECSAIALYWLRCTCVCRERDRCRHRDMKSERARAR